MDKVCGYYGCENIITPDYVPVWKEFKLFGQTWIIGRWKNEVVRDKCIDCSIQKEQDERDQIYNQGVADAFGEENY